MFIRLIFRYFLVAVCFCQLVLPIQFDKKNLISTGSSFPDAIGSNSVLIDSNCVLTSNLFRNVKFVTIKNQSREVVHSVEINTGNFPFQLLFLNDPFKNIEPILRLSVVPENCYEVDACNRKVYFEQMNILNTYTCDTVFVAGYSNYFYTEEDTKYCSKKPLFEKEVFNFKPVPNTPYLYHLSKRGGLELKVKNLIELAINNQIQSEKFTYSDVGGPVFCADQKGLHRKNSMLLGLIGVQNSKVKPIFLTEEINLFIAKEIEKFNESDFKLLSEGVLMKPQWVLAYCLPQEKKYTHWKIDTSYNFEIEKQIQLPKRPLRLFKLSKPYTKIPCIPIIANPSLKDCLPMKYLALNSQSMQLCRLGEKISKSEFKKKHFAGKPIFCKLNSEPNARKVFNKFSGVMEQLLKSHACHREIQDFKILVSNIIDTKENNSNQLDESGEFTDKELVKVCLKMDTEENNENNNQNSIEIEKEDKDLDENIIIPKIESIDESIDFVQNNSVLGQLLNIHDKNLISGVPNEIIVQERKLIELFSKKSYNQFADELCKYTELCKDFLVFDPFYIKHLGNLDKICQNIKQNGKKQFTESQYRRTKEENFDLKIAAESLISELLSSKYYDHYKHLLRNWGVGVSNSRFLTIDKILGFSAVEYEKCLEKLNSDKKEIVNKELNRLYNIIDKVKKAPFIPQEPYIRIAGFIIPKTENSNNNDQIQHWKLTKSDISFIEKTTQQYETNN